MQSIVSSCDMRRSCEGYGIETAIQASRALQDCCIIRRRWILSFVRSKAYLSENDQSSKKARLARREGSLTFRSKFNRAKCHSRMAPTSQRPSGQSLSKSRVPAAPGRKLTVCNCVAILMVRLALTTLRFQAECATAVEDIGTYAYALHHPMSQSTALDSFC